MNNYKVYLELYPEEEGAEEGEGEEEGYNNGSAKSGSGQSVSNKYDE